MKTLIPRLVTGALLCLVVSCQSDKPVQRAPAIDPAVETKSVEEKTPARPELSAFDAEAEGLVRGEPVEVSAYPPYTEDNPGDQCAILEANIARAGDAILAMKPPEEDLNAKKRSGKARYEARIKERFGMSKAEKAMLDAQGFYVVDDWRTDNYGKVYHEIYRSELPLFVSLDSILHPIYTSHDRLMGAVERGRLAPMTRTIMDRLHEALPALAADYPDGIPVYLDLYLTVARRLLHDDDGLASHHPEVGDKAAFFVERAREAIAFGDFEIFGRQRKIDFTAYKPRGRYSKVEGLSPYFRGAMWLSRIEFNLVSRSCRSSHPAPIECDPSETPQEALVALALADMVERTGVGPYVKELDEAWALMAGGREDVAMHDFKALRSEAGIDDLKAPGAFGALKSAIGEGWKRKARLHYMPGSVGELPAISTFLGPRVVSDTKAIMKLSEPEVSGRFSIKAGDVGFMLGHDKALDHLKEDLGRFSDLRGKLNEARSEFRRAPVGDDFYSLWMSAIARIGELPGGVQPTFMETASYRDMRLNTAIVAYGQIRHNNVLVAGEPYGVGGCHMPDAYVEPAPKVYDALIAYAKRGAAFFREADPKDELGARRYFAQTAYVLSVLRRIQDFQLAGRALPPEAITFMNTIVEILPASSSGGPQFNGWYFDLFYAEDDDPIFYEAESHPGLEKNAFVASTFTSAEDNLISYVGASAVHRGVFRVDVGGEPRLLVGPVVQGFEHYRALRGKARLDDKDVVPFDTHAKPAFDKPAAPWALSYTLKSPAQPEVAVVAKVGWIDEPARVWFRSRKKITGMRVVALDHHRRPSGSKRADVVPGRWIEVPFKAPSEQSEETWFSGVQIQYKGAIYNLVFDDDFAAEGIASVTLGGLVTDESWGDPMWEDEE